MTWIWLVVLFASCMAKPQLDAELVRELEELTEHNKRAEEKRQLLAGVDFDVDLSPLGPRRTSTLVEGTVRVYLNGQYGTVCSSDFDDLDATVACKQYTAKAPHHWDPRYVTGQAVPSAAYGQGTGPVLMVHLLCSGSESSLHQCPQGRQYPSIPCSHADDAGVMCHYTIPSSGSIRIGAPAPPPPAQWPVRIFLDGGRTTSEGRVMIEYDGLAKPVCNDQWDHLDARVVCRELGYPDGEASTDFRYSTHLDVWLDDVDCTGAETRLEQCAHRAWGSHDCDARQQAAGVKCHSGIIVPPPPPPPRDLIVQLTGSQFPSEGKVSVYYAGAYYDLCADSWGIAEATVTCRELGYSTGVSLPNDYYGSNQFLDMEVTCSGPESLLSQCSFTPPGQMYCRSNKAATVRCDYVSPPAPAPRPPPIADSSPIMNPMGPSRVLLVGPSQSEGLVYVQNDGAWGTICSNNFDHRSARVVCKELGYLSGAVVPQATAVYGRGMGTIWMTEVACAGNELKLTQCPHAGFGRTSGCTHDQDIGVRCT